MGETSKPLDHSDRPAGLITKKRTERKEWAPDYITNRSEVNHIPHAGKNTVLYGEAINTSKIDKIQHVIKTERPAPPIDDFHTTYNITHAKQGFPYHYPPQHQPEPEVKIQSGYHNEAGSKRHPYEVKSKLMLTI